MQSIVPVDIHCGKLVDWLVQRRHCKRDWGEQLGIIRKRIRNAIVDMPPNEEIKILLTGSRIDYSRCTSIIDILRTTEASTKNIFGYYSSQRMKDWQEIVNLYERDCVFLAEWSTNLIREVSYEIPNLRKNLTKLKKDQEETDREKAALLKQSQNFNNEFAKIAQSYGIKGVNISSELQDQLKVLPDLFKDLVERTASLKSAVEYYVGFAKLTSKKEFKFVEMLNHIINKGNTTLFEYKYGQAPLSIEAPVSEDKSTSSRADSNQADDDIDFGEDLASSESSNGFVHVEKEQAANNSNEEDDEIDFGLDTSSQTVTIHSSETELINEKIMPVDKVARGNDARLILDYKATCNQYLNDLYELEAFFIQRGSETKTDYQMTNFSADASTRGPQYDQSDIKEILFRIQEIISIMNEEKNKTLFQMRDSDNYVGRVMERLMNKRNQAEKSLQKAQICDEKIEGYKLQMKELEMQLKQNIEKAREIQRQVSFDSTNYFLILLLVQYPNDLSTSFLLYHCYICE